MNNKQINKTQDITDKFIDLARDIVVKHYNEVLKQDNLSTIDTTYIQTVWVCKSLKNVKGLFYINRKNSGYYEITYNGEEHEIYLDSYKKIDNVKINIEL